MIGNGLGQPGQRETTHVGEASEVRTPFRVFMRSSLVAMLASYAAMLIASAVWWKLSGFRSWWLWFWYGEWWYIVLLIPFGWWIYFAWVLIRYRYVPEQVNRNWPPPYEAVDVRDVGMLNARNADELLEEDEPPEKPPPLTETPITFHYPNGSTRQDAIPIPSKGAVYRSAFLRGVVHEVKPFSRRGAMSCLYTRGDWEQLEWWCCNQEPPLAVKGNGLTYDGTLWARVLVADAYEDEADHSPTQEGAGIDGNGGRLPAHPVPSH